MFRRWRNTRGFGVHSPFGFQIVQRVIRRQRGYAYYSYPDIEKACGAHCHDNATAGEAKFLLRLACLIKVSAAFLPHGSHKAFMLALRSVNPHIRFIKTAARLDVCDIVATKGELLPLKTLSEYIAIPGRTLLIKDLPDGWGDRLFSSMNEGIMLLGKRNAILISRPQMQKVSYLVSI